MKKSITVFIAILCLVTVSAFAKGPMRHGRNSAGTIASVDDAGKSFVLRSGKTDTTVYWTAATKVTGGTVKADEHAVVRWMSKDGKNFATSIKITPVKAAAAPAKAVAPAKKKS